MNKDLCIVQANCQADMLTDLLQACPQFNSRYELRRYTNFLHEAVPEEELARCGVFIYQHLGEKWGKLASGELLQQLSSSALCLKLPNMLFKGYWPFWTNKSPSEFGDFFLDKLIGMGLGKAEILHVYLNTELSAKFDLKAMFDESVQIERVKEEGALVKSVDFVLEHYREEPLFLTVNHPGPRLLEKVAQAVFAALELRWTKELEAALQNPYPEFELPIHPQVAAFHDLKFAGQATHYNVFGKQKNFETYASNYIDSQLLNMQPLSAYLHMV